MTSAGFFTQVLILASFASLPLLWFIFAGQMDGVLAIMSLDVNAALGIIIYTPFLVTIRSTGLVLLSTAFLQYHLPYGLLPRIFPLLNFIERFIFLALLISGFILIAISYFFS